MSYRAPFTLALIIAGSSGASAWAIRSAENRPHPIYVGTAAFGIVFAFAVAIIAIAKSAE